MRVLVTGGGGYVGSRLVPYLLDRGCDVTVVDLFYFGNHLPQDGCRIIKADIMEFNPDWLNGVDAVVHLAAISNDPMAAFRPGANFAVNTAGTALLAFLCKQKGVRRFVFASTCSVYGYSAERDMDEEAEVSPSFPYGISKVLAERALLMAEDESFRPIILRKGTIFGWSPRMRYDLVVNTMTKHAVTRGVITVHNPKLWRPLIHMNDVCRAYYQGLLAPLGVTGIFNVVQDNYTILQVAERVRYACERSGCPARLEVLDREDVRNYRASGYKATRILDIHNFGDVVKGVSGILAHTITHELYDWDDPIYINDLVYRQRVERDEALYGQWREFMQRHEDSMDHLQSSDWPQEGP